MIASPTLLVLLQLQFKDVSRLKDANGFLWFVFFVPTTNTFSCDSFNILTVREFYLPTVCF